MGSWPQTPMNVDETELLYAPIDGLFQDGGMELGRGGGEPTGIRLRKTHGGGDFDIHNGPRPGWEI